jgi:hypothetical protein
MNRLIFSALCIYGLCCCSHPKSNDTLRLSIAQLSELLSLLEAHEDSTLNYHVQYAEQLNDSTLVLEISQNQFLASQELIVCEIVKFKGSNVFIYSSNPCQLTIPDSLLSKKEQAPFYIPDSPRWSVLVKKRKGQLMYSQINFFDDSTRHDSIFEGIVF